MASQETLPAILERMASDHPRKPFARTVADEELDWGALAVAAATWADRFVSLGVGKGDVVTTVLDSGLESLALWLGLVRIGAIDATINCEFRGRMLAHAIDTCAPALIVIDDRYLDHLEGIAGDLATVAKVLVTGAEAGARHPSSKLDLVRVHDLSVVAGASAGHIVPTRWHDIACVCFTSGTTGPSKAVRIPWGQLNTINLGTFPFGDLDASDVFYCFTAHAHFGSKSIPYLAAMAGGQVVIRPRFGLSSFWPDIARFGITTASLVGSMADMLSQSPDSPTPGTTLRNLFMAPLGPTYRAFAERFDLRICTVYNSTENGVPICSGWNPQSDRTVGRLREGYPGFEVRLVDEDDIEVPDGTPGECVVRSAVPWTMNAGYLNNPGATAEAWRNGWFHTGDALVRNPDGDYSFVDRLKDVIRRRGENISSFEVEADVRLNQQVSECAAVAVPAETSEDEILLFATLRPGAKLTAEELAADLSSRMTRFMVPRYIEIIDAFPKTQATERIVKADLRARGVGPRTWDREHGRYGKPGSASEPRTERRDTE